MSDHDAIREQALDYVYGLLTPEEVTEFESRLTADPTLATELEKARQVQELLAQAAKAEFPNVTFNPPMLLNRANRRIGIGPWTRRCPAGRQSG